MSLPDPVIPMLGQIAIEVPELLGPVEIEEAINWPLWTAVGGVISFLLLLAILAIVRAVRKPHLQPLETLEQLRARTQALRSSPEPDLRRIQELSMIARDAAARHTGRSTAGLTPGELRAVLPDQAAGLAEALHACDQARFAGETVDATAVAEQVKVAINALILLRHQGKGRGAQP